MEWYEKLKEILKDNQDALTILDDVKGSFDTLKTNLDQANAKFEEAKTTRDKAKENLRKVKELFGVDSVDAINEDFIKSLKGDVEDSELSKQIESLKAQLQENVAKLQDKTKEIETLKSEYEGKIQNMKLDTEASKILATTKLKDNPYLVDTFKKALLENVKEIDGVLVPHKMVNGQLIPETNDKGEFLSLEDRRNSMLKDSAWQDFIISDQKAGTQHGNNVNNAPTDLSKMTPEQKYEYYQQKLNNGG